MNANSQFPTTRLRRLRYNPAVRSLVRDVRLDPSKLILPLFVRSGSGIRQPISSMPGHAQLSVDMLKNEVREAVDLGLGGVIARVLHRRLPARRPRFPASTSDDVQNEVQRGPS